MGGAAGKTGDGSERIGDLAQRLRAGIPGAFFRPGQVGGAGITRDQLRTLVRRGVVGHVARGLYRFADTEPTEHYSIAMVCARVPNGIVCILSALSVHEIGTQLPHEVWLAIPHKAEPPRVPGIKVRLLRFSGAAWSSGIQETEFEGVPARITSPARTVVDCFRFERLIGREAALEARTLPRAICLRAVPLSPRCLRAAPELRCAMRLQAVSPVGVRHGRRPSRMS